MLVKKVFIVNVNTKKKKKKKNATERWTTNRISSKVEVT